LVTGGWKTIDKPKTFIKTQYSLKAASRIPLDAAFFAFEVNLIQYFYKFRLQLYQ